MKKKQKTKPSKPKSLPALTRSDDLCKQLVIMAGLTLYDNTSAQKIIYAAVRQLQRLDAVAVEAGILPAPR